MTSRAPTPAAARSPASQAPGAPTVLRVAPPGRLLAALTLITLIGTGCANPPADTRSSGEQPATTSSPTGGGDDQNGPTGAAPSPDELQELLRERRESSECMRENGVEDFPDPDANGHILYYGDDPDIESAREKCDRGQPGDRSREPGSGG